MHCALINEPLERLERLEKNLAQTQNESARTHLQQQIDLQKEYLRKLGYCPECEG